MSKHRFLLMSIEIKICNNCNKEKSISEFHKSNKTSDGIDKVCSECRREYNRKYYKEKLSLGKHYDTWTHGHRLCLSCKNELPFSEFHKMKNGYCGLKSRCKSCEQKRNTEYRRNIGWDKKYKSKRRSTDIQFKLRDTLRGRFNDALRRHTSGGKVNKKHSALILLDCSMEELINHIESKFTEQMFWNNHGTYWEIDHIIPCASFDLTNIEEQKKCFNYSNLQPLTIYDNRSKRDKVENFL